MGHLTAKILFVYLGNVVHVAVHRLNLLHAPLRVYSFPFNHKAVLVFYGKRPVFDFVLGVSIFSALNKYLAKIMNQFPAYDVTMSETHHIHKLDAPSGTAITLAEGILEKIDRKDKWVKGTFLAPDGAISGTNDCAPNELPISSIREGEVFGLHTIRYESDVDTISITHDAKSRGGFVLGAVLAAEYTATHEGFLGMSDLFPFLND